MARLRNHVTDRDRTLLGWLYDHHTLTTAQIAAALFSSLDFAQRRLLTLTELGAITRFRPTRLDGGSYPYHYVLDQLGFTYIMGERGLGMPRRDEARRRLQSVLTRADLRHLLGGNQVFIDLAAHARTRDGHALERWLPSSQFHSMGSYFRAGDDMMLAAMGDKRLPRPDGHGVWRQDGRAVPFFLEYDTGTERLETLGEKVLKYATMHEQTAWAWPVLFLLPSQRREENMHDWVAGYKHTTKALWYTASTEYLTATANNASARVWWPGGLLRKAMPGPLRLTDLPYLDPDHDRNWNVTNPHHLDDYTAPDWTPGRPTPDAGT